MGLTTYLIIGVIIQLLSTMDIPVHLKKKRRFELVLGRNVKHVTPGKFHVIVAPLEIKNAWGNHSLKQ